MEISHEDTKARKNKEDLSSVVVDCAYHLHKDLGPGLLESVYEVVLARILEERGLNVIRQKPIPIQYRGITFDEGFRADLIVEDTLLIELKSVESLSPVHSKQLLTYLRLMNLPLGLLINFGSATFKDGVKRIVNGQQSFESSHLRINSTNNSSNEHGGSQQSFVPSCLRVNNLNNPSL